MAEDYHQVTDDPQAGPSETPSSPDGVRQEDDGPGGAGRWPHLPPSVLHGVWQQAVEAGPRMMGRQVACALALSLQDGTDPLPEALPAPALDSAAIEGEGALTLAALAGYLAPRQQTALLEEAHALPTAEARARALLSLASYLPDEGRRHALCEAWQAALDIPAPLTQARVLLAYLTPLRACADDELPAGLVAEVLDLASSVQETEARLRGLTALAPHLPPTVRVAVLLVILDTITTLFDADHQTAALVAVTPYLLGEVQHRALTVAGRLGSPTGRARALTTLAHYLPPRLQARLRAAALDAIAAIEDEGEQAEALAAFAPHLEDMRERDETFPALLERALAIAVSMKRRDARARALVGLQARLPRHLKDEALAAASAIADEHRRAQLLADLAPSLPPDLVAEALKIARDIRQRDARFLALKALAGHARNQAAGRAWQDALDDALALPRQFERVLALADLAPSLPPSLKQRALTAALRAARAIPRESARMRAIAALAPHLQESLLAEALADARALTNPLHQVGALTALLPFLPDQTRLRVVAFTLAELRAISVEYQQARALIALAPHLADTRLGEALEIALAIGDPYDRVTTLAALLARFDAGARAGTLDLAWQTASEIADAYDRANALAALWPLGDAGLRQRLVYATIDAVRDIDDDYDRASGAAVLAPLLAAEGPAAHALPQESQVLREAVLAVCRVGSPVERAEALRALVPHWLNVRPPTVAYALWCEVLPILSRRPVPHLLADLAALAPLLGEIGGETAAQEAAQAVAAARRWPL